MIKKECFTAEWIEQVSSELHYNDKNLIEKLGMALGKIRIIPVLAFHEFQIDVAEIGK